jgi:hypothetical protein
MAASGELESAKTYQRWIQAYFYRVQLPMMPVTLSGFSIGKLRQIATLFKAYDGEAMRDFNKAELVQFICAYQQDASQFLPLKRLKGVEVPEVENQRHRQLFEALIDPWKRP